MIIGAENKMEMVEKEQYQHNGKGTAILINRNIATKPAREIFNDEKQVTSIIEGDMGKKLILAGIHMENGMRKEK